MRCLSWPHCAAVIRGCCIYLPRGVPVREQPYVEANAEVHVYSSSGFSAMFATSLTGIYPLHGAESWFGFGMHRLSFWMINVLGQ